MHSNRWLKPGLMSLAGVAAILCLPGCPPRGVTPANDNEGGTGRPIPIRLAVAAETFTLTEPGQAVQLTVESVSSDGSRNDVTDAASGTTYHTTSEGVVTVSDDGLVTAAGEGQTTVLVVNAGLSARRRVTVDFADDAVVRLEVAPATVTFTDPDDTVQLAVTGVRNDGGSENLTSAAAGTTYQSSSTSVVTVSNGGLLRPVADGVAEVVVRNANLAFTVDVTVRFGDAPPPGSRLIALSVTPAQFTFTATGQTQQLEVLGTFEFEDAGGQTQRVTVDVTSPADGTTYRSSAPGVATVDVRGLVAVALTTGAGSAVITVENDGVQATARVTVSIPPNNGGGEDILLGWSLRPLPDPRNSHAMAYDAARRQTVLFGGYGTRILGGTWTWDGSGDWRLAQDEGRLDAPSPRYSHAMAYDSVREVVVLFGGTNGTTRNGETWEWNGAAWIQRIVDSPGEVSSHAMAYDAGRGVTVLFGGSDSDNNLRGQTWEWDGASWSRRDDKGEGPAPRIQSAMTYDAAAGMVILFGGDTETEFAQGEGGGDEGVLNDTWGWDGQTWTLLDDGQSKDAPSPRKGHSLCYDAELERVILHGGGNGESDTRTWQWDGTSWQPLIGPTPGARTSTAMVYDASRRTAVLFGGFDGDDDGEVWELASGRWSLRTDSIRPTPRHLHAMTFDAVRGRTVLFGGSDGEPDGETWEYDGRLWALRSVGGPSPRVSSAMTFDTSRQACVLVGGQNNILEGDAWTWNGARWTQLPAAGPSGRHGHALAYDAARDEIVLFGGYDGQYDGETWVLRGDQWTLVSTTGPVPRIKHAMVYDAERARVVLYGGFNGRDLGDTWIWDGQSWTEVAVAGPPVRSGHSLVYDSVRRVSLAFGGRTLGVPSNQTWMWNGQAWTAFSFTGPSGRYDHGFAYDVFRATGVLFGGFNGPVLDDTWEVTGPR